MAGNHKLDLFHYVKMAPKLEKSADRDYNLISSECGHDTPACKIASRVGSIPFFQFNSNFFNLFSIPIPIPLLKLSFNSNSNSRDFNSNSNSGDFKSRKSQFQKWPVDVFLEIDYNYTNKVHVYKIIVINIISLISFVSYIYMASWLILYK